jgi:hypothetical protein
MGGACSTLERHEKRVKTIGGKPEGKRPLGELDVNGKIILELILRKWCEKAWTGCNWLSTGTSGGL